MIDPPRHEAPVRANEVAYERDYPLTPTGQSVPIFFVATGTKASLIALLQLQLYPHNTTVLRHWALLKSKSLAQAQHDCVPP